MNHAPADKAGGRRRGKPHKHNKPDTQSSDAPNANVVNALNPNPQAQDVFVPSTDTNAAPKVNDPVEAPKAIASTYNPPAKEKPPKFSHQNANKRVHQPRKHN